MQRARRDTNIGLRIGDTIIHCNDEFVIVEIRREENMQGLQLSVYAADPAQASKIQEEKIKQDQIVDNGTELLMKLGNKIEKGLGEFGG